MIILLSHGMCLAKVITLEEAKRIYVNRMGTGWNHDCCLESGEVLELPSSDGMFADYLLFPKQDKPQPRQNAK